MIMELTINSLVCLFVDVVATYNWGIRTPWLIELRDHWLLLLANIDDLVISDSSVRNLELQNE